VTARLSVLFLVKNEADRLPAALATVAWADEVVVVDTGSTDATRALAAARGARVLEVPWEGWVVSRNRALAEARNDWVLFLDADERVSPELRTEIQQELADGAPGIDGFYIPRLVHYLGRWWYRGGWYPDYRLRLFRRAKASWGGVNPHEKVLIEGRTRRLTGSLLHFTYADVSQHLQTVNRLTDISAIETLKRDRVSTGRLVSRPFWRFFRSLVFDRGVLEGWPGFFVAATAGFYVFLKYAKALELRETKAA